MRIFSIACFFGAAALSALAQSNELGLQFGKTITEGRKITITTPFTAVQEETGLAAGIVYNRRLLGERVLSLHLHVPLFGFENQFPLQGLVNTGRDTTRVTGFVTPGVMVRFLERFPLQPYGFFGVGYARVAQITPSQNLRDATFTNDGTWGVSGGGGLDLMFGSHFGVRGELRSLTTGTDARPFPGLTIDDPSTRWAATGGVVFRF